MFTTNIIKINKKLCTAAIYTKESMSFSKYEDEGKNENGGKAI